VEALLSGEVPEELKRDLLARVVGRAFDNDNDNDRDRDD